jgi:hypothetical protein
MSQICFGIRTLEGHANSKPPALPEIIHMEVQMSLRKISLVFALTLMVLPACSLPVTRVDVQSFGVVRKDLKTDKAINTVTGVLVDRGFDIKMTNKEAGIITTEFKKFASLETNPPFDYFLQIKGKVKENKDGTTIDLVPSIREQNRMNSAAFTEHMLGYYTGEPNRIQLIRSMRPVTGWRSEAQTLFMNVVTEVAETLGMKVDDVVQKVTKTEANAFDVN